jgi:hypothetical protein
MVQQTFFVVCRRTNNYSVTLSMKMTVILFATRHPKLVILREKHHPCYHLRESYGAHFHGLSDKDLGPSRASTLHAEQVCI